MKIKKFRESTFDRLVQEIEEWIENNKNTEMIQLSHAVSRTQYDRDYTAILVYKEKAKKEPIERKRYKKVVE